MEDGCGGAQSPRVNSELPNLTRRAHNEEPVSTPKRAFPVRSRYGRNAPGAGVPRLVAVTPRSNCAAFKIGDVA